MIERREQRALTKKRREQRALVLLCLALFAGACADDVADAGDGADRPPRSSDFDDFEMLDAAVCDPAQGVEFTLEVDNTYFPLPPGLRLVLEGPDDGARSRVEISVLDETELVDGVATRVVLESERRGGERVEVSRNFYAQAHDGTVCGFGESVDLYEDGEVVGHAGSWRAGADGARPGIRMPGTPAVGVKFALEAAPGAAEDLTAIAATGEIVTTPAGEFSDTIKNVDWNPLEGPEGEIKYHAAGVGPIIDVELVLVELQRP